MLGCQESSDPLRMLDGDASPASFMLSIVSRLPCYFLAMASPSDWWPWRPLGPLGRHETLCYDMQVHNENGSKRVVVTKDLPGTRWLDVLTAANCRVEICAHEDFILSQTTIKTLMSEGMRQCHGVIGQLTEV